MQRERERENLVNGNTAIGMKRSRCYLVLLAVEVEKVARAPFFYSARGQKRRRMSREGGEGDEKKASAVRGHISGTHEIIMVYIKCNLAKRMQRCIEARLRAQGCA